MIVVLLSLTMDYRMSEVRCEKLHLYWLRGGITTIQSKNTNRSCSGHSDHSPNGWTTDCPKESLGQVFPVGLDDLRRIRYRRACFRCWNSGIHYGSMTYLRQLVGASVVSMVVLTVLLDYQNILGQSGGNTIPIPTHISSYPVVLHISFQSNNVCGSRAYTMTVTWITLSFVRRRKKYLLCEG